MASILLVDDDDSFVHSTSELLTMLGHKVTTAGNIRDGLEAIRSQSFDIVLLDLMLPDGSGFEVLEGLPKKSVQPHVAIITGNTAVKSLVKTVLGPNISYLIKPINLDDLRSLIDRATSADNTEELGSRHFGALIGESPQMQELYQMIERVAATRANVLIQGESGVGKELVAQAIHRASGTSGPFIAANCGAISRELISSELFGHEKGAFTGAVSRRVGFFEQANGGTLFLDEVTEMPIDLQPTLLRVLETHQITRLGSTQKIPVDCRIISATNRPLEQLAEEECLREDLYFRLAVFPISVPPLRTHKEDIPLLARSFLADLNAQNDTNLELDDGAIERLQAYDWPGNIRELRHAVHRAFIMTSPSNRHLNLPGELASPFAKERTAQPGLRAGKTISEMEKELIKLTLQQVGGDKQNAAKMLGISLKTLYNRLNAYEKQEVG
ncbi:sigma-54-dependent transcriptional regulator [Gilvimarinus sp. F26214L]|uniref:sigma-54-dependent transcriptional regulator n=1 Tax=Gilvimarinus sp. DZF01 TaxID=3461371 RepID=UPI0040463702